MDCVRCGGIACVRHGPTAFALYWRQSAELQSAHYCGQQSERPAAPRRSPNPLSARTHARRPSRVPPATVRHAPPLRPSALFWYCRAPHHRIHRQRYTTDDYHHRRVRCYSPTAVASAVVVSNDYFHCVIITICCYYCFGFCIADALRILKSCGDVVLTSGSYWAQQYSVVREGLIRFFLFVRVRTSLVTSVAPRFRPA